MENFMVKMIMNEENLLRRLPQDVVDRLPQSLKQDLEEQLQKMEEYRAQYKKRIKQYFQSEEEKQKLFFSEFNGSLELAQKSNLSRLVELAAHCIVIGDQEILESFVISPLKEGKSQMRTEDIGAYCYALNEREKLSSTPEQEKTYLRILVKELQRLDSRSKTVTM
jgi:DNA-binding protein YbaB